LIGPDEAQVAILIGEVAPPVGAVKHFCVNTLTSLNGEKFGKFELNPGCCQDSRASPDIHETTDVPVDCSLLRQWKSWKFHT
jgi:hypothetical protein